VQVRLASVSCLAELKTKRTTTVLRKALDDSAAEVGFAAAKALFQLNDPAGKEALLDALSGETKIASGAIAKAKRDAFRLVHTPKPMFMFALKQGVGLVPVPGLGEGVSSMQSILADPGVSGRASAALMLAKEKDQATLHALREALVDKEASVRAAAVHALALRNDVALETDLVPLVDDNKESVRLRAAAGCLRLELIKKSRRSAPKPPAQPAKAAEPRP
jgi:HEAT repeat protein